MNKCELFAQRLLKWFSKNKRSFPWRETSDPYKVLIAEVFLRKTDAGKVSGIYEHFILRYPGFEALVNAKAGQLEDALRPLGLYRRRAKELKDLAQIVTTKYREVPHARRELLGLPGVGDYIANAVLCFAFEKAVPLLDTNVIRVVARAFSFKSEKRRARDDPAMWQMVHRIMPKNRARDFNLAVLDLAAKVCLPKKPNCLVCPVNLICDYARNTTAGRVGAC
jgi:A/G-specific adenine glycosylase